MDPDVVWLKVRHRGRRGRHVGYRSGPLPQSCLSPLVSSLRHHQRRNRLIRPFTKITTKTDEESACKRSGTRLRP